MVDLAARRNKIPLNIEHFCITCPHDRKLQTLADLLLIYGGNGKSIVFTRKKTEADQLLHAKQIRQTIDVIHGDIVQTEREESIKKFIEGKTKVLVATDIAARGIDIPNVDLVIQLDVPEDIKQYIHRSGRTARAGKPGKAIMFFPTQDFKDKEKHFVEQKTGIKFRHLGVP